MEDKGNCGNIFGIPRKVLVQQISIVQLKKSARKGCKLYVFHVFNSLNESKKSLEYLELLRGTSWVSAKTGYIFSNQTNAMIYPSFKTTL